MTLRRYAAMKANRGTERHCHVCGVTISRDAVACRRHLHALKRDRKRRSCDGCGQTYIPAYGLRPGRYCSRECYLAVANQRPAMIDRTCDQCGAPFRRTQAAIKRVNRSFCSLRCATTFYSGAKSTAWRGGSDPNRGEGWRRIAETARERDGYRCRRCGKTQEDNRQRLSVDHVIPWRTFESAEEANQLTNLVSLCRPCHSRKGRAERLWLQGDVLDMWTYQIAVAQPWTA